MVRETVTLEGHIIDSDVLRRVMGKIVELGGRFEIEEFRVGRTNEEPSFARLAVAAEDPATLDGVLEALSYLGAASSVKDAPSRRPRPTGSCRTSSTCCRPRCARCAST